MTVIELTPRDNANLDRLALRHDRPHKFTLYAELSAFSNKAWLVRDLLGDAEASAEYGAPGSGKSALVEDMALHIAAGWDWHGRTVKQGAVVYVALERRKLVERRAIAFRNKNPDLTDLPFAICGGIQDLRTPQAVQEIIDTVAAVAAERGEPVVLVVIDTLSRALAGGDENSPKDMGAIVNATSATADRDEGAHSLGASHSARERPNARAWCLARCDGHDAKRGQKGTRPACNRGEGERLRGGRVRCVQSRKRGLCSAALTLLKVFSRPKGR